MAGTASCGIRVNEATGTDAAPPRSMSVPASTATSPSDNASASLTSSGSLGGRRAPRSIPLSQDVDMPTSPASTGRVSPRRSRIICIRSPVRFPARSSSISQPRVFGDYWHAMRRPFRPATQRPTQQGIIGMPPVCQRHGYVNAIDKGYVAPTTPTQGVGCANHPLRRPRNLAQYDRFAQVPGRHQPGSRIAVDLGLASFWSPCAAQEQRMFAACRRDRFLTTPARLASDAYHRIPGRQPATLRLPCMDLEW